MLSESSGVRPSSFPSIYVMLSRYNHSCSPPFTLLETLRLEEARGQIFNIGDIEEGYSEHVVNNVKMSNTVVTLETE